MPVPSVLTILRTIKDRGSISRTDLQQLTGLSWGTVTNTTRELLSRRLIREEGATATKAGRKPVRLAINRLSHAIFGLHLEPSCLRIVALNLVGDTLAMEEVPVDANASPAEVLSKAADVVKTMRGQEALVGRDALGIGVALPGRVDPHRGLLWSAPKLPLWKNVPVGPLLHAASGMPACVERTANCHALAERWFGAAGDAEHVLCLLLGDEVDLGILSDGRIFGGSANLAGNISHLPLVPQGPICPLCEGAGCLHILCENVFHSAAPTSGEASAALGQAVHALLRQAIALLDPDAVFLAGTHIQALPAVAIAASLAVEAAQQRGHHAQLLASTLSSAAPALGACGLVLDATFDVTSFTNLESINV
jgi:predicted NBD/HSP70 family sugar kinase